MTDIPIIFSAPMIRALLDGRKTQTRRLASAPWQVVKPGDRLWVREQFRVQQTSRITDARGPFRHVCIDYETDGHRDWVDEYEVTAPKILLERKGESGKDAPLNPSIHMPRVCSRLTLVVTATKIERLHEITEQDAKLEGATSRPNCHGYQEAQEGWSMDWSLVGTRGKTVDVLRENDISLGTARAAFGNYWVKLHGFESVNANPEVVALTFVVHKRNIDAMPKEIAA
jgi:hypothetical protein